MLAIGAHLLGIVPDRGACLAIVRGLSMGMGLLARSSLPSGANLQQPPRHPLTAATGNLPDSTTNYSPDTAADGAASRDPIVPAHVLVR